MLHVVERFCKAIDDFKSEGVESYELTASLKARSCIQMFQVGDKSQTSLERI